MLDLRRRQFFALLGGAAAAWPFAARAQQPAMPVIGFLGTASAGPFAHLVAGFRRGLQETGFVEGRNAAIEYRWAEGQYGRVPALAADLVRRQVAIIVTVGGETSAAAAKAATATIPIVFNVGADPVKLGLVNSLARPGGNATGVNIFTTELVEKRLGLLHDLVPAATTVAVLSNPNFPAAVANVQESEAAARAIGKEVVIFNASSDAEIETAFANIVQARPGALLVGADPFFNSRRGLIVALAARHAVPAIYEWREFAEAGGLGSVMAQALWKPIGSRASMLDASSKARNPSTFRSCSSPNSNWSSISTRPGRWPSLFRRACSLSPTR
jgi:putative ABC transport system substrate-binding protein